jgi:hypothetical protein
MQTRVPPSVLPDISPSRGEIGWSAGALPQWASRNSTCESDVKQGARSGVICPLEGEMSGRTEGGAKACRRPVVTGAAHAG